MSASSFFAVTLSILLGLGAVGGAKYGGWFDRPQPPAEVKQPPIKVLVAGENLFEGMAVTANQVRVRELRADELAHYQKNRDKFLPAVQNAAHMRIASRHVEADTPLMREHFLDQELPDGLSSSIPMHMRAINVQIPRERCSGGLLRVGEYVDVFLTSQVVGNEDNPATLQTACLARGVRIIVKRNNPWPIMTPNTDEVPLNFTLLANSYRAALIEFSKMTGNLTLMPSPPPGDFQVGRPGRPVAVFSDATSAEYRDEDLRIEKVQRSELTIGYRDLERLFKLPPLPVKAIPAPEPKPKTILHYYGLSPYRVTVLPVEPSKAPATAAEPPPTGPEPGIPGEKPTYGYRFYPPDVLIPANKSKSDCPECDAAKKRASMASKL